MGEVLVIGHRNPDTDSICSAIGYAAFKRATGLAEAVAARCGDTNDRIDFVLQSFGMPAPRFVADVSPKVADIMHQEVLSVGPDSTAREALRLMEERNLRILPVIDSDSRCRGLLSLFKLGKFLFPAVNGEPDTRQVLASLNSLARTLDGTILVGIEEDREEEWSLMIGAMGLESFAARLEQYPPDRLVVLVGDRWDIQNIAIREGVRVLIVTGGLPVEPKTIEAARQRRVSLICSPHDTATTASLCRAAVGVRHVLNDKYLSFREQDALSFLRARAVPSGYLVFPVTGSEGRVTGVVTKSDLLKTSSRKLILVDHNELTQAVPGAEELEILEIIDHHRIGALSTAHPILFRNEPVGSTSTIVADCFLRNGVALPSPIAGLLLAGVISDTLNLTSPTTTPHDAEVLGQLEERSGVNAKAFTEKLFASGSVLTLKSAPQAITTDCKEYEEGGVRFSVAQIEETGFAPFAQRKEELRAALRAYAQDHRYGFSALLITDVATQGSLLLVEGAPRFTAMIDYPEREPGIFELMGVVSRKKQVLPYLAHRLRA